MSAIDDIAELLDTLKFRKEEMAKFEGLLSEVSVTLSFINANLGKPDDDSALIAMIAAIQGLKITAPDVHVTVQAPPISVPQPQIVVMPADEKPVTGWKLLITQRDGNGAIREISLKPEV